VSRLRKNGQLNEACELAEQLLVNKLDDVFNRRAAAWVYIDFLKLHGVFKEETLSKLEKLCALGFDASEKILWEQLYWVVAKAVFKLTDDTSSALLDRFEICCQSFAAVPGQAYSVMLKALVKQALKWKQFSAMVASWGLENFQTSDFENETLQNGRGVPSLVERTYLAVSKAYLMQPYADTSMLDFLQQLNTVSEAHPEMLYLIYYRALLYQKMGQLGTALALLRPFAQKKKRDFWVWDLLAQLHPDDHALQMACLAKALMCTTPPEFLVKIRQRFAELLVGHERWEEARVEIEALIQVREANHWRIPSCVYEWVKTPTYQLASKRKSNYDLYTQLAKNADALLFSPSNAHIGIIWHLNTEKQTAQFFVDEAINGGFCYAKLGVSAPEIGQAFTFWLQEVTHKDGKYWKVDKVVRSEGQIAPNQMKSFNGRLQLKGRMGFVGDVFVDIPTIAASFEHAQLVEGTAVRTYNLKNKEWGWKANHLKKYKFESEN
jgi:hypothetical protein